MNVLFVSYLGGQISAGPSWSVPARIHAQEMYDNVFWINIPNTEMPHWKKVSSFHNLNEYGKLKLDNFPSPFNQPDVVVFENFYSIEEVVLAKNLVRKHIPYVVVPRGSLTKSAKNNKSKIKKWFAHKLLFDNYVKNATAVQFLTKQELMQSVFECENTIVLSNGITIPESCKTDFSTEGIRCVFIGRVDAYLKGLDLLISACGHIKTVLRNNNVTIDIYGPKSPDSVLLAKTIIDLGLSGIISLKGEISGKDKENVLMASDVFVLTSRTEGHPMGLIEALSYGLPCIVSRGTNMSEEINQYDAGWTCEGSTVESISSALLSMINERNFFSKKSKNARSLSLDYNWSELALKFHHELKNFI